MNKLLYEVTYNHYLLARVWIVKHNRLTYVLLQRQLHKTTGNLRIGAFVEAFLQRADHPPLHHSIHSTRGKMTMTMDQRNHHLGSSMNFDHMGYSNGPHFTNPWSAGSPAHPQLFTSSNNVGFDAIAKQQAARSSTASMPYSSLSATAPSMGAGFSYGSSNLLDMSQDLLNQPRSTYEQGYSAAPSSAHTYAPTSAPYVSNFGSLPQAPQHDERRLSHTYVLPNISSFSELTVHSEAPFPRPHSHNRLSPTPLTQVEVW